MLNAVLLRLWCELPREQRSAVLRDYSRDFLVRLNGSTPGLQRAIAEALPPAAQRPFADLVEALRAW